MRLKIFMIMYTGSLTLASIMVYFPSILCLSTGDGDYFHSLAYLFRKEVIAMCQRGELSAAGKEKIDRRKKKRPLAEKV